MAHITRCDRCSDLIEPDEQAWIATVDPLRIPRPRNPLDPEVEQHLCGDCHTLVVAFLRNQPDPRPCLTCGKPEPYLVHCGWLKQAWGMDTCDGRCGLDEVHAHHPYQPKTRYSDIVGAVAGRLD